MHIISKKMLDEFWKARKDDTETAKRDLSTWYKLAKNANWANFASLKRTFGSADQVGHCVVFDVGNNRYRLIGLVKYGTVGNGTVFVRKVMDHKEYDKQSWPDECGCHKPASRKMRALTKPSSTGKKKADVRKKRS